MEKTVTISAIGCQSCIRSITSELEDIEGVQSVTGSPETKTITVTWQAPAEWEQIRSKLAEIEFPEDAG